MSFEAVLEQDEAKRLLCAALADDPAHAYLFHGPAGVGKMSAALRRWAKELTRASCAPTRQGRMKLRRPRIQIL